MGPQTRLLDSSKWQGRLSERIIRRWYCIFAHHDWWQHIYGCRIVSGAWWHTTVIRSVWPWILAPPDYQDDMSGGLGSRGWNWDIAWKLVWRGNSRHWQMLLWGYSRDSPGCFSGGKYDHVILWHLTWVSVFCCKKKGGGVCRGDEYKIPMSLSVWSSSRAWVSTALVLPLSLTFKSRCPIYHLSHRGHLCLLHAFTQGDVPARSLGDVSCMICVLKTTIPEEKKINEGAVSTNPFSARDGMIGH